MIALDTNVLIYAVGTSDKADAAGDIVDRAGAVDCVIPLQVLAEFANACRRKSLATPDEIEDRLTAFSGMFAIAPTALEHIGFAAQLAAHNQLAYFDALICVIARDAGATVLLTEDMHDGLQLGSLIILNPFEPTNRARLDELLRV